MGEQALKKILLTGAEGFVGRNLAAHFGQRNDIVLDCPGQHALDLTDSQQIADYLDRCQPDIIIHSATSNTVGKGYDTDVCEQNLRMFFNLLRNRPTGCTLYTLCSGSSYNRENWIENMSEDYLGQHIPTDSQGFSKFVIASHARHLDNVVTLRLFGVFGKHEDHRYKFISNTIAKRLIGLDVVLFRDARYHYLDVADFCAIVERLIDGRVNRGEFNVTPDAPVSLSQLIETVDRCLGVTTGYTVVTPGLARPYTGDNHRLKSVLGPLDFTPIDTSIRQLIDHYAANIDQIDAEALRQDQLLQYAKRINSQ